MAFIGLDLSLTATGVAVISEASVEHYTLSPPKGVVGPERLDWFQRKVCDLMGCIPDGVAVEGYSYGSQHSQAHKIGELGGTVKLLLYQDFVPTILVPPSCVKKFTTGKGTAPKGTMIMQVFKRWGIECKDDNQADAVALAKMSEAYFFGPMSTLTDFQKAAMQGVELLPSKERAKAPVRLRTRHPDATGCKRS